jgi:hypothetical protein
MAYEESLRSISLDADASIGIYTGVPGTIGAANPNSGKQYCWVKITGEHTAGLAGATDRGLGILQNKPQMVGAASTIGFAGVSKALVGAVAITAGARVSPDANGATVLSTGTGRGTALESGVAGAIIPVLLD